MTQAFVVDASIAFGWVHPHQATIETDRLLKAVDGGATFVVPPVWFLEVANALLILQRRKRITPRECSDALTTLIRLNPAVDEAIPGLAVERISQLAQVHGLTIYDAAYLEVALRRKLPLASRDETLLSAARRCGLKPA